MVILPHNIQIKSIRKYSPLKKNPPNQQKTNQTNKQTNKQDTNNKQTNKTQITNKQTKKKTKSKRLKRTAEVHESMHA